MTRILHVLRDRALDGPTNMARDEHLLHSEDLRPAVLRLYAWSPATISLGYFQRYDRLADLPAELRALDVVRRTTGGGAILHDRELTYCLVVDESIPIAKRSPDDLYKLVHDLWRRAMADDGIPSEMAPDSAPPPSPRDGPFFCFQKPGRTDLIVNGEKLLGSAQRRTGGKVLQHGSLMLGQRYEGHPGADPGVEDAELVERWVDAFIASIAEALELSIRPATWTDTQLADVANRRDRYAGDEWTRRR